MKRKHSLRRSRFIDLLMQASPGEDPEIVFLGDGEGSVVIGGHGYYIVYETDFEPVLEKGKVVAISINIL